MWIPSSSEAPMNTNTRINNGDIFSVEGFTQEGDIRLEKGKLLPKDWGHMSLGYVDTSYSSQGKTVDRVFIAVGSQSLPATNQQQWYVSASRGREMAKVYVEDKQEVRDAIARTGHLAALMLAMKHFICWYRAWEYLRKIMDYQFLNPIIAKLVQNKATDTDLAKAHLASLPKNIAPDLRDAAVSHIARAFSTETQDSATGKDQNHE
jgi:hypothetical protein